MGPAAAFTTARSGTGTDAYTTLEFVPGSTATPLGTAIADSDALLLVDIAEGAALPGGDTADEDAPPGVDTDDGPPLRSPQTTRSP